MHYKLPLAFFLCIACIALQFSKNFHLEYTQSQVLECVLLSSVLCGSRLCDMSSLAFSSRRLQSRDVAEQICRRFVCREIFVQTWRMATSDKFITKFMSACYDSSQRWILDCIHRHNTYNSPAVSSRPKSRERRRWVELPSERLRPEIHHHHHHHHWVAHNNSAANSQQKSAGQNRRQQLIQSYRSRGGTRAANEI